MSGETGKPEDTELEAWLEGLGGRGGDDDPVTRKLRETVLKRQRAHEAEVDELRLRRGREQLLARARSAKASQPASHRGGPLAIAASIVLMVTVGVFSYQALITDPAPGEAELLMYYGDLERPRGGTRTLAVDVDAPLDEARALATRLGDLGVPFELTRDASGRIVLSMMIVDVEAAASAWDESTGVELEIETPGFYVLEFE